MNVIEELGIRPDMRPSEVDATLARIDWDEEPAGERMDMAVTLSVWGGLRDNGRPYPSKHYSTNAQAALSLLADYPEWECSLDRYTWRRGDNGRPIWHVTISGSDSETWESEGEGETLPLAVCRAYLRWSDV